MSVKRSAEVASSSSTSSSFVYDTLLKEKNLQPTELKEDSVLKTDHFTWGLKVIVAFDHVFNKFYVTLDKESKLKDNSKSTSVCLSEQEVGGLLAKLPLAVSIAKKYLNQKSHGEIEIPFELSDDSSSSGYSNILFVKINNFPSESNPEKIIIDIRKCGKKTGGGFIYTKNGIRVNIGEAEIMHQNLQRYIDSIDELCTESSRILKAAECFLIIKNIYSRFNEAKKECAGCKTDHPSQKQHGGSTGCMRDWCDIVDDFWGPAQTGMQPSAVLGLGNKIAQELGTFLAASEKRPHEDCTDHEKKHYIYKHQEVSDEYLKVCEKLDSDNQEKGAIQKRPSKAKSSKTNHSK